MEDELNKRINIIIKYTDLAYENITKNRLEISKELEQLNCDVKIDKLCEIIKFINKKMKKWQKDYKDSGDILCINIKDYILVEEKVNILINECLLIDDIYPEIIDYSFTKIGEELSKAIKTGGKIDNINIIDLFNLFINSLDGMINDTFYKEEKESILNVKEMIMNWKEEYKNSNKLSTISNENINKIYKYVISICKKYKNIEEIEKNYAENIQYCYSKIEALREKELNGNK